MRTRGAKCFLFPRRLFEGGLLVVTYSDLFQYTLVIIGIVGLFFAYLSITNNRKK